MYSPLGRISGGHLNPAVTTAFWVLGKMTSGSALKYSAAQVAGALAALLVWDGAAASVRVGAIWTGLWVCLVAPTLGARRGPGRRCLAPRAGSRSRRRRPSLQRPTPPPEQARPAATRARPARTAMVIGGRSLRAASDTTVASRTNPRGLIRRCAVGVASAGRA
ncbi:aquaporin [Microbispora sp. GKU 823]|uniref:aquaporin n=1 Tax=Microbispora sp. GKU 823 TaxID=1652100 RepID=UPI0009A303B5|nr:hypothetical protein B1L11_44100 [Microbispora sp. GKU 823]